MLVNINSFVLVVFVVASTTASWCSDLTSSEEREKPCFLSPPKHNPVRLRSSGNSLVLPCYVARSRRSTIEWWYQDFQNTLHIKIYPVFPAVRPTVLRFMTKLAPVSKSVNDTDVSDVSVILRHVNVDDSGIYQCVIRPWSSDQLKSDVEEVSYNYNADLPTLSYHIELTGPRLCQASLGSMPCFSGMRTSSPTVLDAYRATFLPCVVQNHHRPTSVFWVAGNETTNEMVISDHFAMNQHMSDRLRRIFPLSPEDFSIELTVNPDITERAYSCVINGVSESETSLFTYIIRSIDDEEMSGNVSYNRTIGA